MRRRAAVVALLLAASTSLAACSSSKHEATPSQVAQELVHALQARDDAALQRLVVAPGAAARAAYDSLARSLGAQRVTLTLGAFPARTKDTTSTSLDAAVDAPPFSPFTLHGTLSLVHDGKRGWQVAWTPTTLNGELGPGEGYQRVATAWPARAPILGAGDVPLTTNNAVMVTVGIEGQRIKDRNALVAALGRAGISGATVTNALATAAQHPTWFLPVADLAQADYLPIKSIIYPVPGTVFQTHAGRAAISAGLASHLVGATGPITAELLHALGPPYSAHSTVGCSGLERAYERQLAGRPGAVLRVVDGRGHTVRTLARIDAVPGRPVRTTIEPTVQAQAEAALRDVPQQAALVVIRASTGAIVATVSHPDADAFDLALDGHFPPGSTFKIITATDLLEHGLTRASTLSCPVTITVDGRTVHNFEGETKSTLSFEDAFAQSCNAAFIGAAKSLPPDSLGATARAFGLGAPLSLGVAAYSGSVPNPVDAVDQAATAMGQGRVLVSPVAMAMVAATVARGRAFSPTLVVGQAATGPAPAALPAAALADLRSMMTAVVTRGAAADAKLPAGTFGKTGAAEFGNDVPPKTHAWFVGYRGDLAFALVVVGGGVGGRVAAPIVGRFLQSVGQ